MYSFRYHLVTICSVFVALALGLLLGAAIASSELAQSTTDDMVESMLSRYETLVDENVVLEQEIESTASLTEALTATWGKERLDGRTIILLFGNSMQDVNLQSSLAGVVTNAGGSAVNITVHQADFGLDDTSTREVLQEIVKAVPGEDYEQTLAEHLVKEWSYVYTTSSAEVTDADFEVPFHAYSQVSNETDPEALDLSGGLVPQTPFQTILFDKYPLTRALLTLEIISVNVDYSMLATHGDPEPPIEQLAAYEVATAWQLPYGVNGLINGFATGDAGEQEQAQVSIQMTLGLQEAGEASELVYPSWLRTNLPKSTSGDVALPNYYTLLVQPADTSISMGAIASAHNLSCVTTPNSLSGHYSLIALLSGAQSGVYGDDRESENHFPLVPEDTSGRAAFR